MLESLDFPPPVTVQEIHRHEAELADRARRGDKDALAALHRREDALREARALDF